MYADIVKNFVTADQKSRTVGWLRLRQLSPDHLDLLYQARGMIVVHVHEDPTYHPADNRLG